MSWNWQQANWPDFIYKASQFVGGEETFFLQAGVWIGTCAHISQEDQTQIMVDLITNEAIKTSEIEGELLNRESLKSSIRKNFGLPTNITRTPPAERGMSEMRLDLYRQYHDALTHETLYNWHHLLMAGRRDITDVGRYRTHEEPMQIISGPVHKPKVYFEAPPSEGVYKEMDRFIAWFNRTSPEGGTPLPPLTRASMAHFYFVTIHPFEDGNGRIGRALVEKVLSQSLEKPVLLGLSQVLSDDKKAYYSALEKHNKTLEITSWIAFFSDVILKAQNQAQNLVDFLIQKTKLYERVENKLNARQAKVVARLFQEGPAGFKGGLSAENYTRITSTSQSTATRDLHEMVTLGVLIKKGELKHTRYWLNISN